MCDFCENSKLMSDSLIAYGVNIHEREAVLSNKRTIFVKFGTFDRLEINFPDMNFKIRFCPICGRKLEEEKELPWVTVGNWKPVEAKEIGKPQEKIEVANFESDYRKNAVYLEVK